MEISDHIKIREIQEEFAAKFPHLRVEFYTEHHEVGEGSPDKQKHDPEKTIGEARTVHNEGNLSIDPGMSVGDLENTFYEKYGLNVQVFRRSGSLWLQTISTDDWTLEQQNEKGSR